LTPFVKDTGKELVKTVGEIGFDKAKQLLGWLKQKFGDDAAASKDLSRFEADPHKFEPGLHETIKEKLERDPQFAAELKKRIEDIGPTITVFQEIRKGEEVIGVDADEVRSGQVTVTQKADDVGKIIGFRTKRTG
jgi:hypothetical protein